MRAVRETDVERYLRDAVALAGGFAEKHVSPGRNGVPDRIVSWPYGFADWVETKRPKRDGGRLESHQKRDHKRREAMGHRVWTIYTKEQADEYIEFCKSREASVQMATSFPPVEIERLATHPG
jgi:hypothetical protein